MALRKLETDMLIVGAGAMGMAFADVVLSENPSVRLAMVDRHPRPGGHWNDAYPFVSLHQPAAFYGVNSERLGSGGAELATGAEILAYYDRVMRKFVRTKPFEFFPMCEYHGDGRIVSNVDASVEIHVTARERVVDATYMNVQVPSIRAPAYTVAEGVSLVPLNDLPKVRAPYQSYVVIGAGKTGIDAVLFLLDQGVAAERISWVISNDAWFLDRDQIQPGRNFKDGLFTQFESIAESNTVDEVFHSLERNHRILRLDPEVWPTKYRCATVNREELAQLRRIENLIRRGRVQRIEPGDLVLDQGSIRTHDKTLFVDCSADGLARREVRPVFEEGRITLQSLSMCQQVFSAAVIAHLVGMKGSDAEKNELCRVVPHPEVPRDFVNCMKLTLQNLVAWTPRMGRWLFGSRLNLAHHESTLTLLHSGWRLRKQMPALFSAIDRILAAEGTPPRPAD